MTKPVEITKEANYSDKLPFQTSKTLWLFLAAPLALYLVYEMISLALIPTTDNADNDLLIYQAGLAILVVGGTLAFRRQKDCGWALPRGWFWLVVAGPLWLGVFTPIGAAWEFYQNNPAKILLLFAISALVAINEESIFRGWILGGLQKSFSPMVAALLSSFANLFDSSSCTRRDLNVHFMLEFCVRRIVNTTCPTLQESVYERVCNTVDTRIAFR